MLKRDRQTKHQHILSIIASIKNSFIGAEIVYTMGSCYQFHLILKSIFPSAQPYTNHDHIISKIGRRYYDINGSVCSCKVKKYIHFNLLPEQIKEEQERHKWSFDFHKLFDNARKKTRIK